MAKLQLIVSCLFLQYLSGIFFFSVFLISFNSNLSGEETEESLAGGKNFFPHDTFSFGLRNDNPFLNLLAPTIYSDDDFGYSHAVALSFARLEENGVRYRFLFDTSIYSQDIRIAQDKADGEYPQLFREISTLVFEKDNLFELRSHYLVIGAGIGLMNDQKTSSPLFIPMAAEQQKKWHRFKSTYLTPETTPNYDYIEGDVYDLFGIFKGALGIVLGSGEKTQNCSCEMNIVKLEGGIEIRTIQQGSFLYFTSAFSLALPSENFDFISLSVQNKMMAHQSGDFEDLLVGGVKFTFSSFAFQTGFWKNFGHQNEDFYAYVDQDAIWYGDVAFFF